jgi:hypothetical protein
MTIQGIDVSSYQGSDISGDLSGMDFCFVKVSEGQQTVDSGWQGRISQARDAGVVVGAYHYGHCDEDVASNVELFVNTYGTVIEDGDLLVLDWEDTGGVSSSSATAWKDSWISQVQEAFPNNLVGLYCNTNYWLNVDTSSNFGDFLWIASYGTSSPGISASWSIWQYTDSPVDTSQALFNSLSDMQDWAWTKAGGSDSSDSGDDTDDDSGDDQDDDVFPGAGYFGPGESNAYVTQLGTMLIARGAAPFYSSGPGPDWSDVDGAATAAFQTAQGWSGTDANGIPGEQTWDLLTSGGGNSIPDAGGMVPFPSGQWFEDAPDCWIVTAMGNRLVAEGASCYSTGPGSQWTSSDQCSYALWQQDLGYSGTDADGWPGPSSWAELAVPGA